MTDRIYLDYAAAAPRWTVVTKGLARSSFANPDSPHESGRAARAELEMAQRTLARHLACGSDELILTSGATEANNLAIFGIVHALHETTGDVPHIITSTIEHPSVLAPIEALEEVGVPVTFVPVTKTGQIDLVALEASILPETGLVSIMAANNEIGTIQPLREIRSLLNAVNPKIILHTDAAQLAAWQTFTVDDLRADAITISGAKLGGLIGTGLLYLKRGTPLMGQLRGGGQQQGRRAGTPDPTLAMSLATALGEVRAQLPGAHERVTKLRVKIWQALAAELPTLIRNDQMDGLPNILSVTLPGLDAEAAVYALSAAGVDISTGSACSVTDDQHRGHVLAALGRPADLISTLRFSLGWQTTAEEIAHAIPVITDVIRSVHTQTAQTSQIQQVGQKIATRYATKR